jgi:anaerobic magnesium-protoporphyrin IX monomethyl ester cyclase
MRFMKILLINPPVFRVDEPWYDTPPFVRTGLAYVAGYIRQFPEFEVKIIDCKFERLNFDDTLKRVLKFNPDIVGLGAFTNEIKPAAYLARLIKEQMPETVIVAGGVHLTAIPERTLDEFPEFDIGVVGEGEVTFYELCYALKYKKSLSEINGLVFRDEGKNIVTSPRERVLDQDSVPFPAWDLLPSAQKYVVMSLRGCPFNCIFCMNPNGRVVRTRSIDSVIEELKLISNNYDTKEIMFGDELFSVDMERTKLLLNEMIKHGLHKKLRWWIQTHVRFVDKEMCHLMKKAGCVKMGLGIETGDEEKLKNTGKGTTMDMIVKARQAAKEANLFVETYFIIGQPDETLASMKKTMDLAVKMNPDLPIFGIMSPYPGTEIARMAANGEAGYKLVTTDWNEYNKQIGGALEFASLSRKQIEIMQVKAYTDVFLKNHRYLDFLKFLWHYRVGAFTVFKKMLGLKPKNEYEKNSKNQIKLDEKSKKLIVNATQSWQKWQVQELGRAKKVKPNAMKIKHV